MLGRSPHRDHVSTLYAHSLYLADGRRNERHSGSFHFRKKNRDVGDSPMSFLRLITGRHLPVEAVGSNPAASFCSTACPGLRSTDGRETAKERK